ncbi:hypothetical protein VPH35_030635 [Triticum aestivum]
MVLGGWRAWMRWWVRSEWRRGFPRSDLDGGGSSGRFFAGGMGCGGLGLPAARGGCYARPRRHGGGGGGACRPDFAFFWPAAQVWGPGPAWLRSWLWVAAARWLCRAGSMAARRVDWGGGWISGVSSSIGGPFRPSALSSSSGCYLRRRFDPPLTTVHCSSRARQQDRPRLVPDSRMGRWRPILADLWVLALEVAQGCERQFLSARIFG